MKLNHFYQLLWLLLVVGLLATPSLASQSVADHAETVVFSSYDAGHSELEAVASKPVTLVEKAKLAELDRNRHRQPKVEAVELSTDSEHSSLLVILIAAAVLLVASGLYLRSSAFTNRKLSFKLSFGFGVVILLALAIGGGSFYYMNIVNSKNDLALAAGEMDMMVGELTGAQNAFVIHGVIDKVKGDEIRAEINALLVEFSADVAAMKQQKLEPAESATLGHIKEAVTHYKTTFANLADKYHAIEQLKQELDLSGEKMTKKLETVIHVHEQELDKLKDRGVAGVQLSLQIKLVETLFVAEVLSLKLAHGEVAFLLDKHVDRVGTMEAELSELYAMLATAKQIIAKLDIPTTEQQEEIALLTEVETSLHHYQEQLSEVIVDMLQVESDLIDLTADIEEIDGNCVAFTERMDHEAKASKADANIASLVMMVLALLIGSMIATMLTRAILKQMGGDPAMVIEVAGQVAAGKLDLELPSLGENQASLYAAIRHMVNKLKEKSQLAERIAKGDLTAEVTLASEQDSLGKSLQAMVGSLNDLMGQIQMSGEQIASGSGQVADASQSLSQGATEQASSLEEISASLNEMSSQTSLNAENANQANVLSSEAQQAAEKGSSQMQAMVGAMNEINAAGQNISKIIKTIDEIAFQTNLLALNAAVEAARAGQHGKGFAVVAEEVRNLAARSAKAAEETAELIQGSVEKTENGSAIANQTAEALQEIVGGIGKVTDLVAEIAAASNEQAQGVSQINQGVSQIDQVTQQNTASAEECAAASEELSSQAEQLRQMLQRFTLKQGHQEQRPLSPVAASVPSRAPENVGWTQMAQEQRNVPAQQPQIALDDSEFGKY